MSEPLTIGGVSAAGAATQAAATAKTDAKSVKEQEGFERMLLGQLTKELVETAMPDDPEAAAATGAYKQMLPDALTEALMSGGGIGLAKQLADAKKVFS
jgi:Rod binding domain-containing protein